MDKNITRKTKLFKRNISKCSMMSNMDDFDRVMNHLCIKAPANNVKLGLHLSLLKT